MTSEKASRNSLLPSVILPSTSLRRPPRLRAERIPLWTPTWALAGRSSPWAAVRSARSSSPSVSSAARVPASSKLAERRRVTLRWSGVVEGGAEVVEGDE